MSSWKRTRPDVDAAPSTPSRRRQSLPRPARDVVGFDVLPDDLETKVTGHDLRIDDVSALVGRALDYDAAEWLLRRAAAPTPDVLH